MLADISVLRSCLNFVKEKDRWQQFDFQKDWVSKGELF